MDILPMTADDIPQIAEIEKEAFPTHPWSEALFYDELNDCTKYYFVAHDDDCKVIAYGGFAHILDEAHIMNIAVLKECRHMGYGRKILCELMDAARALNASAMTLEVAVDNTPALNLYKSVGFVSFGVRPNYYGKGEHAEILWMAMD